MRRGWILLLLAVAGCWDFEALSNGDGGLAPNADLAGRDAPVGVDLTVADLATPPDLYRRKLSFAVPTRLMTDTAPSGIAVADFDGNGSPDFAVISGTVHSYSCWTNQGNRSFTRRSGGAIFGGVNTWVGAGKIYGTGHVDLVVPNSTSLKGDGQGNFTATSWTNPTASTPSVLADLDGDGHLDLATGDGFGVHLLYGDGAGNFTDIHDYLGGKKHLDLAGADLDGDGFLDIVQADGDPTTGGVIVFHNDKGALNDSMSFTDVPQITAVATGDLDGDGDPDLVATAGGTSEALVFLDDKGTLTPADTVPLHLGPMSAAIGDLDGDGLPDVVVSAYGDGKLDFLLGAGKGKLVATNPLTPSSAPGKVLLADFDSDGLLDILVALPDGSGVEVYFNTSM